VELAKIMFLFVHHAGGAALAGTVAAVAAAVVAGVAVGLRPAACVAAMVAGAAVAAAPGVIPAVAFVTAIAGVTPAAAIAFHAGPAAVLRTKAILSNSPKNRGGGRRYTTCAGGYSAGDGIVSFHLGFLPFTGHSGGFSSAVHPMRKGKAGAKPYR
jgi:hypothetical protein